MGAKELRGGVSYEVQPPHRKTPPSALRSLCAERLELWVTSRIRLQPGDTHGPVTGSRETLWAGGSSGATPPPLHLWITRPLLADPAVHSAPPPSPSVVQLDIPLSSVVQQLASPGAAGRGQVPAGRPVSARPREGMQSRTACHCDGRAYLAGALASLILRAGRAGG